VAKRKSNPDGWFVTQHEFKQMLYIIAHELNEAKARITALEGLTPGPAIPCGETCVHEFLPPHEDTTAVYTPTSVTRTCQRCLLPVFQGV
jgi:hypothetical protein